MYEYARVGWCNFTTYTAYNNILHGTKLTLRIEVKETQQRLESPIE